MKIASSGKVRIAASLNRMDPQKKSLAKIRVQQVLYEVDFSPPFPQQLHVHFSPSPSFPPFPANFDSSVIIFRLYVIMSHSVYVHIPK